MRTLVPYPLLAVALAVMWLLLSGFTPGHFVLAVIVSIGATNSLRVLGEASPKIRRWLAIPELFGIVLYDIVRSNIAVATVLMSRSGQPTSSGFIIVPIRLRSPAALATLSVVLTATPGTAWLDYNSARGEVLIHVFDLVDDHEWLDLIANRYERLLMEIFE